MITTATCALLGLLCPPAPPSPTVASVQAAYEREAATGDPKHDKGLEVLAVECGAPRSRQHLCWITFTTRTNPERPLYYDVASIEETDGGFKLTSGLCRR